MEVLMSNAEFITVTIDQYSTLWRIRRAQPEGVVNPTLEEELKILEIKLHAMGVNTGDLKM